MSTPTEIEQLINEKTRLEEESRALDEELKQLETRSKILSERIAVQELKNENDAKRQTISELASRIGSLETRLEQMATGTTAKQEEVTSENAENQEAVIETNYASEEDQGQDEDTIRVMALDNEQELNDDSGAEEKESQELFY